MPGRFPGGLPAAIDRHPLAAALLVFALALAIRAPGIANRSLWLDEAWTLFVAQRSPAEIVEIARQDHHPPGYYLLAAGWERALGLSEASIRSLSLLASALSAVALLLLARRFFGGEAALYATLLSLASGEQAYYATEARSYALTGLLCVLSFHVYLRGFARSDGRGLFWLAPLNALAVWVHFTAAFAFLAQLAGAALVVRRQPRAALRFGASQIIALVLFLPEAGHLFRQMPRAGEFWLRVPGAEQLLRLLLDFAGGSVALALYGALFAAGAVLALRRHTPGRTPPHPVAVVALWAFLPIAAAFVVAQATPVFLTRYLLFASFGWFLLAAVIASALPLPAPARSAVAAALAASSLVGFGEGGYPAPDWRAIAASVERQRSPGAMVIVSPAHECLPLGFYLEPARFRAKTELIAELAGTGVHCTDSERDLPRPQEAPERLIHVLGPRATLQPERVLRRYGAERYRVLEVDRFDRALVVTHDLTGP